MAGTKIDAAETVSLFCRLNLNGKKELPMRSSEMGLLILLVTSKEKITPKAAADFFGVSKPMVASMVKSLTLGGYIRKEAIEQDKRKYILIPEAKAVSLVEATLSEYVHTMTLLENGMGKQEFSELMRLLEKANAVLQLETFFAASHKSRFLNNKTPNTRTAQGTRSTIRKLHVGISFITACVLNNGNSLSTQSNLELEIIPPAKRVQTAMDIPLSFTCMVIKKKRLTRQRSYNIPAQLYTKMEGRALAEITASPL